MKLTEFKNHLTGDSGKTVVFVLPGGREVPVHAHVTEVARIDKRFIDCGGSLHTDTYCRLQVWVAGDIDHRLSAGKLAAIIEKAASFLGTEDHEVDVEYEDTVISQYPVVAVEPAPDRLAFKLGTRHTECLAQEKCAPVPALPQAIGFKSFSARR